jgi:hypothetical protein
MGEGGGGGHIDPGYYEICLLGIRRDGIVMNSRITAGVTVQVVWTIFPFRINRLGSLFWINKIIKYISGVMIINMIIWAWS